MTPRKPKVVKDCRWCGEMFTALREDQKYCSRDCSRRFRGELPASRVLNKDKTCIIGQCALSVHAKNLCRGHYMKQRKGGDMSIPLRTTAPPGTGYINNRGYMLVNRKLVHRTVMEEHLGRKLFPNENVHHLNGDKLDNRIDNLELWVKSQPSGQRVADLLDWAYNIIERYEPKR